MLSGLESRTPILASGALAATYFAAAKLGLTFAFINASATAVWPPAGIALAALLVLGYRVWPGILLGAFLANLTTTGTVTSSIGIAFGNTLEALLGAYLVVKLARGRHAFDHPLNIFKFAALAAVVSPAIAATLGVSNLILAGSAAWNDFGDIWVTWWLGDAGGVLIVGPLLILWSTSSYGPLHAGRKVEAALVSLALVLTALALFGGFLSVSVNHYPLEFLVFPALAWAAFRFGPRETAAAACLLSAMAIWGTLRGFGPFAGQPENESLLLVQAFVALAVVPSLVLAAAVRGRQRADEAIHYLADASVRLTGVLDHRATLESAVRLAVPALADCCVVRTNSEADAVESALLGYQNPSIRQPLEEVLCRYPFDPRASHLAGAPPAEQSGLYSEIPDTLLVTSAQNADHLGLLRSLHLKCAMIVPLIARGQTLGTMSLYATRAYRQYEQADLELAEELARRTAMALDNARLYAQQRLIVGRLQQLHGRLEALERERLLEDERRRIARELHDDVEQTFFGIGLSVQAALDHADRLGEPFRSNLATVLAFAERGTEQLREAIFALNRAKVEDLGLVPGLWRLVRDFRKQAQLEADLVLSGHERRVSPETAETLYAVAREALTNVERHARASAVVLSVCFEPDIALLSIQDDGAGASPLVLRTLANSATHFGLRGLRERVNRLGGTFIAQSGEDGGFVVRALVPLQESAPQ